MFSYKDIDTLFLSYCDLIDDYPRIAAINKDCHYLVIHNDQYIALQHLLNYILSQRRTSITKNIMFIDACRINNPLCRYLFNKYFHDNKYSTYLAFSCCCEHGNLEIAKWLYDAVTIEPARSDNKCFMMSIDNGHLSIAKWLLDVSYDKSFNKVPAFHKACASGYLDVAQWLMTLHDNKTDWFDFPGQIESIFYITCYNGQLDVAKWLINLCEPKSSEFLDISFTLSCEGGNLDVVKWLFQQGADIHYKQECPFQLACIYGQLHILQWLLEKSDQTATRIDISNIGYQSAFVTSCKHGHIHIAKWLIEISHQQIFGVITDNDYRTAILECIDEDRYNIADWLTKHFNSH